MESTRNIIEFKIVTHEFYDVGSELRLVESYLICGSSTHSLWTHHVGHEKSPFSL